MEEPNDGEDFHTRDCYRSDREERAFVCIFKIPSKISNQLIIKKTTKLQHDLSIKSTDYYFFIIKKCFEIINNWFINFKNIAWQIINIKPF